MQIPHAKAQSNYCGHSAMALQLIQIKYGQTPTCVWHDCSFPKIGFFRRNKPSELFSGDITYLPTQLNGIYFYMYLFMGIFSHKIVGFNSYIIKIS